MIGAGEEAVVLVRNSDVHVAEPEWLDDALAPDFARTVDIHRKPGYDPVELLLDPQRPLVKAGVASKLLRKKLGFRTVMDVISLDPSIVRGTHGRLPSRPEDGPVLISSCSRVAKSRFELTEMPELMLEMLFGG